MTWIILSVLTALFESGKDALGKKGLERSDEYIVACSWRVLALPFLLPLLAISGLPALGSAFWPALMVSGGLNVITAVAYMRAIRLSDLSVTVPLVAFTPLFLLVTSPLLLGEVPGPLATVGIALIVAGSYLLHFGARRHGAMAPFRALVRESGPRWMLAVALLWSISANVDKVGVQNSSPLFWAIAVNAFIACGLLPLGWYRLHRNPGQLRGNTATLLAVGLCGALTSLCQMSAISLAMVPYVIAIKRTSILFSVLWGHWLFGEAGFRQRLTAAAVMLAGVVLILCF